MVDAPAGQWPLQLHPPGAHSPHTRSYVVHCVYMCRVWVGVQYTQHHLESCVTPGHRAPQQCCSGRQCPDSTPSVKLQSAGTVHSGTREAHGILLRSPPVMRAPEGRRRRRQQGWRWGAGKVLPVGRPLPRAGRDRARRSRSCASVVAAAGGRASAAPGMVHLHTTGPAHPVKTKPGGQGCIRREEGGEGNPRSSYSIRPF